jgi:hypothetical protein
MRERDEFGKYFMPLAYLVGMVGLGLLAFGVIDQIQTDARNLQSIGMNLLAGSALDPFFLPVGPWAF